MIHSSSLYTSFLEIMSTLTTEVASLDNLTLSPTESRALDLLGKGVPPGQTAAALGITDSAISQLLSKPEFAEKVAELRYKNLLSYSERDNKADSLEDKLLRKLEDLTPFLMRPMEVARIYQIVNGAKRRGQSAPESIVAKQEVVQLIMPVTITNKFTVNSNNQVVQAGHQPLITVQSGSMQSLLQRHKESQNVQLPAPGNQTSGSDSSKS